MTIFPQPSFGQDSFIEEGLWKNEIALSGQMSFVNCVRVGREKKGFARIDFWASLQNENHWNNLKEITLSEQFK